MTTQELKKALEFLNENDLKVVLGKKYQSPGQQVTNFWEMESDSEIWLSYGNPVTMVEKVCRLDPENIPALIRSND